MPIINSNVTSTLDLDADATHWRVLFCTLLLAAAILALRKFDAFVNPQFWAEDGRIFFREQYLQGCRAVWEPYAGYLHLAPRWVACVADVVAGPALAPALYNGLSLAITMLVLASIFDRRLDLPYKPALALAVVLTPHPIAEVFVTITNIQWIMALALLQVLLKADPPQRQGGWLPAGMADHATVLVCGLTGPFSVLFAPLYAVSVSLRPTRHRVLLLISLVVVAAIQCWHLAQSSADASTVVPEAKTLVSVVGLRLFGGAFIPYVSWRELPVLQFGLYGLLLTFLLYATRRRLVDTALMLGAGIVVVAAAMVKFRGDLPQFVVFTNGPRYFYIAHVGMAWVLIIAVASNRGWCRQLSVLLLLLMLATSLLGGFRSTPFVNHRWTEASRQIGERALSIPINPPGWSVDLPPRPREAGPRNSSP